MTRVFLALGLFVLPGSLSIQAQEPKNVILAARRGGDVEFIDPQTLQTLASLHFSLPARTVGLNGVSLSADGGTLYLDGPMPSDPLVCCALYSVDLTTFQARVAASIAGTASRDSLIRSDGIVYPAAQLIPGNPIRRISDDLLHLSPDGHWLFGVKSFRGPAIEAFDLTHGGALQELRPKGLTGNWWPSGLWSSGLFYLNAWSDSGDRFQFKPELLLECRIEGGQAGWIGRCRNSLAVCRAAGRIGCPIELKVILPWQAGPVEDFGLNFPGQHSGKDVHGQTRGGQPSASLPGFGSRRAIPAPARSDNPSDVGEANQIPHR